MEDKYKQLHRYLDSVTIDPHQALYLTEAMITYFTHCFKVSRADVIAGTIKFCTQKGVVLHVKKSPPTNTDR